MTWWRRRGAKQRLWRRNNNRPPPLQCLIPRQMISPGRAFQMQQLPHTYGWQPRNVPVKARTPKRRRNKHKSMRRVHELMQPDSRILRDRHHHQYSRETPHRFVENTEESCFERKCMNPLFFLADPSFCATETTAARVRQHGAGPRRPWQRWLGNGNIS